MGEVRSAREVAEGIAHASELAGVSVESIERAIEARDREVRLALLDICIKKLCPFCRRGELPNANRLSEPAHLHGGRIYFCRAAPIRAETEAKELEAACTTEPGKSQGEGEAG